MLCRMARRPVLTRAADLIGCFIVAAMLIPENAQAAGAKNPEQLVVLVRVQLTREGKLAAPPVVLTSGNNPLFVAARDSAIRAIFRGQPYDMLRQETYETWKDVEITFDPRQMFGG